MNERAENDLRHQNKIKKSASIFTFIRYAFNDGGVGLFCVQKYSTQFLY